MPDDQNNFDWLVGECGRIWGAGGWAMWAIAIIAMAMFSMGVHIYLRLRAKTSRHIPEEAWRRWINTPGGRHGTVGKLLDRVGTTGTVKDTAEAFEQLRMTETAPFARDLKVMKVCVSAAPLVGLLGTVTGMLTTFHALSAGSGGDKTMAMIARGISEALITTETGLVVALPGLFLQHALARRFEAYRLFLAHLETACTQAAHRRFVREKRARKARTQAFARKLRRTLMAASPN